MEISFDPAKRASNLAKHGLDLADAAEVLSGIRLETPDDRCDYGEARWLTIGLLAGRVVACIWAERDPDGARIISLRKATKNEEEDFVRQIGA